PLESGQAGSELAGSTLIVLGDVSGKGLKAAMIVSLIVGAIRTIAETTAAPSEVLACLNRRLSGRLHGGFATCIVLHIDANGRCAIASAGHPGPFLNQREVELPSALPLGIVPDAQYEERSLELQPGDYLALYTDGLLEARSAGGEIFSFERLEELFAARPDASEASDAAVTFGQEDDITVVTLSRSQTPDSKRPALVVVTAS
ncbi:MAG TPA: PP2C family protein-serine/threonine phosphatase, partial [Acidobacteriaceae bacterium]